MIDAPERRAERRLITCLFLDIVGSTDLTMRLPPERLQRALDEAFGALREIVHAHGGTVEKYIGDAVFALFGAPIAHADDSLRALRAAEACAAWAEARRAAAVPFAVRIGVETGEALVDLTAAETERQRMAVGLAMNVAARLQAAADPGQVLVGPRCAEAAAEGADLEPLGELELKGVGAVAAWRLVRVRPDDVRTRLAFVGREGELARLRDAFETARAGRATLALVSGPPGQGKTRLAQEFLASLEHTHTIEARCRPSAETGSAPPLRQLLADSVSLEVTIATLQERLARLFDEPKERERVAAALIHSAGLGTVPGLPTNPIEMRDELLNAWRHYLEALAREGTVVAWIEDLHWAEPELVRLLDRLTSASDIRLLVLGTARPEFAGSVTLRPGGNRVVLELAPLDEAVAQTLARSAGAADARAIDRAAGNPLFIIELARSRAGHEDELPMNLRAAIAARLDELPGPDRDLLQRAAIIGETFGIRDVVLLTDRDPADAAGALARLVHRVYLASVSGRFRFHHALVHEVAYGRLPIAERMRLHARYARDGVDPENVEALAHHWWEAIRPPDAEWVWEGAPDLADMRREAFAAHLAAGRRLADRFAHERAIEVLGRALELAANPNDTAETERALGIAYSRHGLGDDAWQHRMRAIATYLEAGIAAPATLYAETLTIPVFNYAFTKSLPDDSVVLRLLDEGVGAARSQADPAALARLLVLGGYYTSDPEKTAEAGRIADAATDQLPYADTLARLAIVQMLGGDMAGVAETYERVERALTAGASLDEPEYLAYRSTAELLLGRIDRSEELSERFMALSGGLGPHLRTHALQGPASVAIARADWPRAIERALDVERIVQENADTPFCLRAACAVAYGATASAIRGDRASAERLTALIERILPRPSPLRANALALPYAMFGRAIDPRESLPPVGAPTRPWHRQQADPALLHVAIGLVVLERWDDLDAVLRHLDSFAARGSPFAGALCEAIREELLAARGGAPARHAALKGLGFDGISELLSYRPA